MNNYTEIVEPYGWELILDCQQGNDGVRSKEAIADFAKTLVSAIGMEAYGEPIIEHFGKEGIRGYTLVQLIQTSSITVHFCDDSGDFYLNCHSCKPFSEMEVIRQVNLHFNPKVVHRKFITRGATRVKKSVSTFDSDIQERVGC